MPSGWRGQDERAIAVRRSPGVAPSHVVPCARLQHGEEVGVAFRHVAAEDVEEDADQHRDPERVHQLPEDAEQHHDDAEEAPVDAGELRGLAEDVETLPLLLTLERHSHGNTLRRSGLELAGLLAPQRGRELGIAAVAAADAAVEDPDPGADVTEEQDTGEVVVTEDAKKHGGDGNHHHVERIVLPEETPVAVEVLQGLDQQERAGHNGRNRETERYLPRLHEQHPPEKDRQEAGTGGAEPTDTGRECSDGDTGRGDHAAGDRGRGNEPRPAGRAERTSGRDAAAGLAPPGEGELLPVHTAGPAARLLAPRSREREAVEPEAGVALRGNLGRGVLAGRDLDGPGGHGAITVLDLDESIGKRNARLENPQAEIARGLAPGSNAGLGTAGVTGGVLGSCEETAELALEADAADVGPLGGELLGLRDNGVEDLVIMAELPLVGRLRPRSADRRQRRRECAKYAASGGAKRRDRGRDP